MSPHPNPDRPCRARQREARRLQKQTGLSYQQALAHLSRSSDTRSSARGTLRELPYDLVRLIAGSYDLIRSEQLADADEQLTAALAHPALLDLGAELHEVPMLLELAGTALEDGLLDLSESHLLAALVAGNPDRSANNPPLLLTVEERAEHDYKLGIGEYNLSACRILDAHHQAEDEDPDDPTGTCKVCGFADGWRPDGAAGSGFHHYTMASVTETQSWCQAHPDSTSA